MATWFVTGANRGIGLGICQNLLAKGENVIGACRNPEGARDLWELASDFKNRFRAVKLDVSDAEDIARIGREFVQTGQTIDVLINNAGVLKGDKDGLLNLNFEDITKSFEVNTIGPMRVTRALMPALKGSKNPKIASITSQMGSLMDNKSGGYYAYRMSKAALNMFHCSLAIEFPEIVSLVVHPGWVQTQMGGSQAPLQIYDSVKGVVDVIQNASRKDSGSFRNFNGETIPW